MKVPANLYGFRLSIRNSLFILTFLYLIFSFYLYSKYGIKIMNDSPRYLIYADNLSAQGIYFDRLNFWYISYVFFVYFSQLIHDSHWIVILNQYILGYVAMLTVFATARRLSRNLMTGFLAALVFIFFPDNLNWHSYVLTESFYCSILCIAFYFLVRLSQEKEKKWLYFVTGLVLLICFFSKPTSPALFIALATPFIWKWLKKPRFRVIKFTSLMVAGALILILGNKIISAHSVMLIYEKGDIIFAMHQAPDRLYHESMMVSVPKDLKKSSVDQPILQKMISFVFANPLYFFKLFIGKVIMYIFHIRPYWSWTHNIFMILALWPMYVFSISALKKKLVPTYLRSVSVLYVVFHTTIIAITWVDWDGRFFIPLLPLIVVLGTIGLGNWSNNLKETN